MKDAAVQPSVERAWRLGVAVGHAAALGGASALAVTRVRTNSSTRSPPLSLSSTHADPLGGAPSWPSHMRALLLCPARFAPRLLEVLQVALELLEDGILRHLLDDDAPIHLGAHHAHTPSWARTSQLHCVLSSLDSGRVRRATLGHDGKMRGLPEEAVALQGNSRRQGREDSSERDDELVHGENCEVWGKRVNPKEASQSVVARAGQFHAAACAGRSNAICQWSQ